VGPVKWFYNIWVSGPSEVWAWFERTSGIGVAGRGRGFQFLVIQWSSYISVIRLVQRRILGTSERMLWPLERRHTLWFFSLLYHFKLVSVYNWNAGPTYDRTLHFRDSKMGRRMVGIIWASVGGMPSCFWQRFIGDQPSFRRLPSLVDLSNGTNGRIR
jgi:hypothetical protein